MGTALDLDGGTVTFSVNGEEKVTVADLHEISGVGGYWAPLIYASDGHALLNFGQGGQAGLTYFSGAGGRFKYAPPDGFKALSSANLPRPAVENPRAGAFAAELYTGNGDSLSVQVGPSGHRESKRGVLNGARHRADM